MPTSLIPSLGQWQSDTYIGVRYPRGKQLKKVDSCIKTYNSNPNTPNLKALKSAYFIWQLSKEDKYYKQDGWRSSKRNIEGKNRPIERLHNALFPKLEDQDCDDFTLLLQRESKRDCVRILYGAKAKFLYKDDVKDIAKQAYKDIKSTQQEKKKQDAEIKSQYNEEQRQESGKIHRIASDIANQVKSGSVEATSVESKYKWVKDVAITIINFLKKVANDFLQFVKDCWRSIRDLLISLVAEICIAILPGINALVAAAKSVEGYVKAVKTAADACYQRFKDSKTMTIASKSYQINLALKTFINNEFLLSMANAAKQLISAIENNLALASSITIPGNVAKVLSLTAFYVQKIAVLAKEYYYTRKINRLLSQINKHNPYLSDELLKDPLVAAYLIINATDSTLFSMVRDNTDMATWLSVCDTNLSQFEELKKRAEKYLKTRKIKLAGLKEKSLDVGPVPFLQQIQEFDTAALKKVSQKKDKTLLEEIREFDKSSLNHVTTKEKRGLGLLDEITRFNKSKLAHSDTVIKSGTSMLDQVELFNKAKLNKASTNVKRGVSVLDQVELFGKSQLSKTTTKQLDPLVELRKLEMQLKTLDWRILNKTLLGYNSFSKQLNQLDTQPITLTQWKKASWVKFGRRHDITKSIDKGILAYGKYCGSYLKTVQPAKNCKAVDSILGYLSKRLEIIQRDVLYPTHQWLQQLDATHRSSPRRPAMNQLNVAAQCERNALQQLAMSLEKINTSYRLLGG